MKKICDLKLCLNSFFDLKTVVIFLCLIMFLFSSGCSGNVKVIETRDMMGTFVTITAYGEDRGEINQAVDEAFGEIERIESIMSEYNFDSELSQLNKDKIITSPSPEFVEVMDKSLYYGSLTYGAFDVTVKPLIELYSQSFSKRSRPPGKAEIEPVLEKVDYTKIHVSDNNITLGQSQSVTLGGIAKGYAVSNAIDVLKEKGVSSTMVNAGGDIEVFGQKPDNSSWNIALSNPRDKDEYIASFLIINRSIVTSGDYERYFDEDMEYHHIVDPKTGYPAKELISATIITSSVFDADALSTSVFVLGADKGLKLIESIDDAECLLITKEREIIESGGLDKYKINNYNS